MPAMLKSIQNDDLFLPHFCGVRIVLALVVIAQLLAFVIALAPHSDDDYWADLGLVTLFIQWVALSSAALLCLCRPLLRGLHNILAAVLSYLLVLAVTALISFWVFKLLQDDALALGFSLTGYREFLLRNLGISAIVSALALRYFYVQHQWKKNLRSEAEARVQALQSRIRPHFLFNSMNIIASLTRSKPELAEAVVHDLSDLFRASLGDAQYRVTLGSELELARKYAHIEKLRLGERLNVIWDIDQLPSLALLPALTLQPLLENAIYHGIEPLTQGGEVSITGHRIKDIIYITIRNPLPDTTPPKLFRGNHMALDNIRQRLEAYYGARGKLIAGNTEGGSHYQTQLIFPYERGDREPTDRG